MDDTNNNNNNNNNNFIISSSATSNYSGRKLQEQHQQPEQPVPLLLLQQQEAEQKHQRLTKQLSNLSTQEIKRELEHVHGFGVSTLALLRGKASLVEALVDARLQREDEDVAGLITNEATLDVSKNDISRNYASKRIEGIVGDGNAVVVVPGVGNIVARSSTTSNGDSAVTVIPGVGNVVGTGSGVVSTAGAASSWKYSINLDDYNTIGDGGSDDDEEEEDENANKSKIDGRIDANYNGDVAEVFAVESSSLESESSNWYSYNVNSERDHAYNDIDEELQQLRQWQQQQQRQQKQSERNDNDDSTTTSVSRNKKNNAKLRELQIAYEFERVQSTMSSPEDVRSELESKFGIGTKYFLGTKEMEYALAVARVDYAIERRLRLGLSVDGEECINFYDDDDDDNDELGGDTIRRNSQMMETCQDLPTPEDLIAMEYDNLLRQTLWEEDALAEELESQYGIPAKHFMGKKEMAYALAVERVDRAMKEGGGYIMDEEEENDDDVLEEEEDVEEEGDTWEDIAGADLSDGTSYYAVMSDEDMMKMMEEEMRKEREEEKVMDAPVQSRNREEMKGNPARSKTASTGGAGSLRGPPSSSSSSSFGKIFKKEQPNPFILTKGSTSTSSSHLQTTPLAEMIKNNDKRERRSPPKRTPLSSEPPLGRQRLHPNQKQQQQYQNRQYPLQTGTVIGEEIISPKRDSKSLADILKGSEEQQRMRPQVIMSPTPRPTDLQGRQMSSHDNSFLPVGGGRSGSSTYRSNDGAPVYGSNSVNNYVGENRGGNRRSESNARATQRPFEPAPFTEPGTHNAKGRASSASRQPGGFGGGPQRTPPQTPFTSPVTDGTRRSNGSTSSSQGPFTPFTAPGKRSTNNKPPPRKRPSDPRRFNIKDTPETTQPFVTGSYVDYNTPYSPPLQVEPPPRDPRYQPTSERPFEPAPYSNQGARASGTGANRGNNEPNYGTYRQNQEKSKGYTSSAWPFNKWKDMFSGKKWEGEKKKAVANEEPKGFKSGNVEVLPSDNSDVGIWSSLNNIVGSPIDEIRQQAVVVEIIDAKQRIKSSRNVQDEEDSRDLPKSQPSAEFLPNAWKGGPEAAASTFKDKSATRSKTSYSHTNIASNGAMQKAKFLLATNPDLRAIVTKAHTNPKLREAVKECIGNPSAFGLYLNDSDIGPILNELKQRISQH